MKLIKRRPDPRTHHRGRRWLVIDAATSSKLTHAVMLLVSGGVLPLRHRHAALLCHRLVFAIVLGGAFLRSEGLALFTLVTRETQAKNTLVNRRLTT